MAALSQTFFLSILFIFGHACWALVGPRPRTFISTPLFATSHDVQLMHSTLSEYGCDPRLLRLRRTQLPVLAECFINGDIALALIADIIMETDKEPKFSVQTYSGSSLTHSTIDVGQITTIWDETCDEETLLKLSKPAKLPNAERSLDRLYRDRVGRGRSDSLTKKDLNKRVSQFEDQIMADRVLRRIRSVGRNCSRLVDSAQAAVFLIRSSSKSERIVAAHILSRDVAEGGRFKRWPCIYVTRHEDNSISLINGGWVIVDQSVRAGAEARKFVDRVKDGDRYTKTAADERICRRLECLAMGEPFGIQDEKLELDVREVLHAFDLPASSDGAKNALVQMGRWSRDADLSRIQPWSRELLDAAAWLSENRIEDDNRNDLTKLPAVCVDEKRTAFRDDAIGVRPRAGTGRPVNEEASKWEILVHIADVSDIYVPSATEEKRGSNTKMQLLRSAAKERGTSRYDLPLGPLHLLPPSLLESFSFGGRNRDRYKAVTLWAYIDERNGKIIDAGVERAVISPPLLLSYDEATALMDGNYADVSAELQRARTILLAAERNLSFWASRRKEENEGARKREQRLASKEIGTTDSFDGYNESSSFTRSRSHRLVDESLNFYSFAIARLLRGAKAPIPQAAGADASRGGRVATAPLRRFIDGQAQRQVLAVLCGYGEPMNLSECKAVGVAANRARNAISNIRSIQR